MKVNSLYPGRYDIPMGYTEGQYTAQRTAQFGTEYNGERVENADSYFLGWISSDDMPRAYGMTAIYYDDQNNLIFKDITEGNNYPCGYAFNSSGSNESQCLMYYKRNDAMHIGEKANKVSLFNQNYPMFSGRANWAVGSLWSLSFNLMWILYHNSEVVSSYPVGNSYSIQYVGDAYDFLMGKEGKDTLNIILDQSENISIRIKASDFANGSKIFQLENNYSVLVFISNFWTNNGSYAINGSNYVQLTPQFMVKTHTTFSNINYEKLSCGSNSSGDGIVGRDWIESQMPRIENPLILYTIGMSGEFTKDQLDNINNSKMVFNGNMCFYQTNYGIYSCPVYTFEEITKAFCLAYRGDTTVGGRSPGYVENITYATDVNSADRFLARWKTGTLTNEVVDQNFKKSLRPWQYLGFQDNNFTEENVPGPIASPFPISPWSIKETEDDKKVVDTFPYDKDDAGGGTFYSLIRSKIKYDEIGRDENGSIQIKGLSLNFEDAVRKSSWQENYKILSFLWDEINMSELIDEPVLIDGNIIPIEPENGQIVDLSEYQSSETDYYELKQGFYKGQLISYYKEARPSITIKVNISWIGYTKYQNWEGKLKVILTYEDEDGVVKNIESDIIENPSMTGQVLSFEVRALDKNNQSIKYTVSEEFLEGENYWSVEFINQIIEYNNSSTLCKIRNYWVKDQYSVEEPYLFPIKMINNNFTNDLGKNMSDKYYLDWQAFLNYLYSENGLQDWIKLVKDKKANTVKPGEIKAFCSDYTWVDKYLKANFRIFPYLTIIERKVTGRLMYYNYRINAETEQFPNPFEKDMEKMTMNILGTISEINGVPLIKTPYAPSEDLEIDGAYSLSTINLIGTCAGRLFYKKGTITTGTPENPRKPPYPWVDSDDAIYINDNLHNLLFYAGSPEQNAHSSYTKVKSSIIISNTALKKDLDNNIILKNFCIYVVDNLCLDSKNVQDTTPYYYKISVQEPATINAPGILKANLVFNENKTEDFIIIPSESGADPDEYDPVYNKHLLKANTEENFVLNTSNILSPDVNKIITAYEGEEGDLHNFVEEYNKAYS